MPRTLIAVILEGAPADAQAVVGVEVVAHEAEDLRLRQDRADADVVQRATKVLRRYTSTVQRVVFLKFHINQP